MSTLIPRLTPAELDPELAELLRPRVERLGYLGEFFRVTAHQPKALMSFCALTEDLKHALPNRLTEVVALTVATALDNAYECIQHERLSLKLGFGEAWVRAVLALAPAHLGETERAVQELALAVVRRHGKDTECELDAVVRAIGHKEAVAVLMLIGRYVMHALIVNTLDLAPPVASPLG